MQVAKRLLTPDGVEWVVCGRCRHKLMKITNMPKVTHCGVEIEIKCSSCKTLNQFNVDCFRGKFHDKR